MAKRVVGVVRLQLDAGTASPAPPVGPALSNHMVNIMQFVKEYNEKTASMRGTVVPVDVLVHPDASFTLVLKSPPASALLRKAAKIQKGSSAPGATTVATIKMDQVREIAKEKLSDLNARDVENAARILAGSARSMGIEVTE